MPHERHPFLIKTLFHPFSGHLVAMILLGLGRLPGKGSRLVSSSCFSSISINWRENASKKSHDRGVDQSSKLKEYNNSSTFKFTNSPQSAMTFSSTSSGSTSVSTHKRKFRNRAFIAVGSNMGDKFDNIRRGLEEMTKQLDDDVPSIHLIRTSFLHETAPMYCTDQPAFLNGVFEVETTLEPSALLERLKKIEQHAGRNINSSQRYGPRPLDLDILIYQKVKLDCPEQESLTEYESVIMDDQESNLPLTLPHPRMQERDFVLTPICEIDSQIMHPQLLKSMGELKEQLRREVAFDAVRVIPLPNRRFLRLNETIIMGILNVTPDSFSDGGKVSTTYGIWKSQFNQISIQYINPLFLHSYKVRYLWR